MSRHGDVKAWFGGDERYFRMPIGVIRQWQEAVNAGPVHVLMKIELGQWTVDDLRDTLKFGLIGGGMKANDAEKLMRIHFDEPEGYGQHAQICHSILKQAVYGPEDEPLPKGQAEEAEQPSSKTEKSPSPLSTDGPPSSPATPEPLSTTTVSGNSTQSSPPISTLTTAQ